MSSTNDCVAPLGPSLKAHVNAPTQDDVNQPEAPPAHRLHIERVEMPSTIPATAISSHLAVRPEWLAKWREEILEPSLPIVDPHHHLIDRPESGTYLLPDLLADTGGGHNVVATVYLEWLSMYRADGPAEMKPVGEVEFANGVAA